MGDVSSRQHFIKLMWAVIFKGRMRGYVIGDKKL